MFQFRRFPSYAYLIQRRMTEYCSAGFPHSVIHGSMDMCSSPWLIAACHDLLRLLMPRHSPCALISLTFGGTHRRRIWFSFKNYADHREVSIRLSLFYPTIRASTISCFICLFCCLLHILHLRCSVFKVRTFWSLKPDRNAQTLA